MRMSHIYQPVMLMTLLGNRGACSTTEIAREMLSHDRSQIEYYENVTNNMVGRVLRNHGIVRKEGSTYQLLGFDNLTDGQTRELINLCREKLDSYLKRRGGNVWEHRKKSSGYISGT